MSHLDKHPSKEPITLVWVASEKESRLHLVGAESDVGLCGHGLRDLLGSWPGKPPHIQGYVLCEPCCAIANIFPVLTGPRLSPNEARPTEVIPRVDASDAPTERLPVLRDGVRASGESVCDTDAERNGDDGVPGRRYLPRTPRNRTRRRSAEYRPRHALDLEVRAA